MLIELVWLFAAALAPDGAAASDALVTDVEQRAQRDGVDAANAYLADRWGAAMQPLNDKTARCELSAVSLALRLHRTRHARAAAAHVEALRLAAGRCTRFVLALARPEEVVQLCASLPAWGPAQTARELRRRIADIDADAVLRASRTGQACRAAYRYELTHTRVVVRPRAPGAGDGAPR